jgi:hypothetical protein
MCKDIIVWAPKDAGMIVELMEDWLECVWEYIHGYIIKATEYACSGCISW